VLCVPDARVQAGPVVGHHAPAAVDHHEHAGRPRQPDADSAHCYLHLCRGWSTALQRQVHRGQVWRRPP